MTIQSSQLPFLLLHERNHGINNVFCSAISIVSLAVARYSSKAVKAALIDVEELLYRYAEVHNALQMLEHDAQLDASAYLHELYHSINNTELHQRNVDLVLAFTPLWLQSEQCSLLGMIVYELITNAARNAFCGKNRKIGIELSRVDSFVECMVSDNGSVPINFHPGHAPIIVNELAKALWWAIRAKVRNPWLGVRCDVHHQDALGAIGMKPTCRRRDLTADNRHNRREDVCTRGKMFVGQTGPQAGA
jgi:two-component sensor histidine kinase